MFSFNDVHLFSVCLLMHYPFAQRMRLLRLRGVPDGVVPAGVCVNGGEPGSLGGLGALP
jgi:hypothetical protein